MTGKKGAQARIKINKLLELSGWHFEDNTNSKANIQLEPGVDYSALGDDFEHQKHGFIDFLLIDKDNRPLVVVEAKRESIDPLFAKEYLCPADMQQGKLNILDKRLNNEI